MRHPFYLVDVFAERPYAGNPLAVVVDADDWTDERRQQFAAEINFSDTTYVTSAPEADGGYRVRIFTPAREIAFAGHPILGTAWVVRNHVARARAAEVRLHLSVAPVPVTFESSDEGEDEAWFRAPSIAFGPTCAPEAIARALGLSAEDIDRTAPVQQLSAGISAMIVPLTSLDALRRSQLDLSAFAALAAQGFPPLLYLITLE